jgi:hypothetical protein
MSDLLSAASLLLAIIGVLNSLWYAEISAALALKLPRHAEDRQAPLLSIRSVLWAKSVPLALASLSVSLVFLPPSLMIAIESLKGYYKYGIAFLNNYDAIATSFVLVEVFATVIAAHSIVWACKLWKLST